MAQLPPRPFVPPLLAFAWGILAISSGSILARQALQFASPPVVSAYRLGIAALILAPVALGSARHELSSLQRKDWILAALSGIFLALHFVTWISSLRFTTVASSVILVSTAPLWVALLAPLLLRENVRGCTLAGMVLALAGSTFVGIGESCNWVQGRLSCPPWKGFFGAQALWGDLLALLGGVMAALYLLAGRFLRSRLSLLSYIFVVYGIAALVLLIWVGMARLSLVSYPVRAFGWFVALALIPQLLGHSTFNWALRHVPAALVSVALLGEPIGSTVLAYLFLDEVPRNLELLGGGLILIGLMVASLRRQDNPNG
ncbi:MAG: DMT family transporter [Anaerolineales bacterium]|nr:DMT family transporter [Anaerolineales bacterium]MDW8446214.1 DMT family transporter [Anaerolineales bacterium]